MTYVLELNLVGLFEILKKAITRDNPSSPDVILSDVISKWTYRESKHYNLVSCPKFA